MGLAIWKLCQNVLTNFIKGGVSNFKVDLEGEFQKDIQGGNGNLMEDFPNLFRSMNVTLNIDHLGLQNGFDIQYNAYLGW